MLVLSRKRDEKIVIGGEGSSFPMVSITVVDIRGDKVRLGVEAPKEITVHRQEVYDAIKRDGARTPPGFSREERHGAPPAA